MPSKYLTVAHKRSSQPSIGPMNNEQEADYRAYLLNKASTQNWNKGLLSNLLGKKELPIEFNADDARKEMAMNLATSIGSGVIKLKPSLLADIARAKVTTAETPSHPRSVGEFLKVDDLPEIPVGTTTMFDNHPKTAQLINDGDLYKEFDAARRNYNKLVEKNKIDPTSKEGHYLNNVVMDNPETLLDKTGKLSPYAHALDYYIQMKNTIRGGGLEPAKGSLNFETGPLNRDKINYIKGKVRENINDPVIAKDYPERVLIDYRDMPAGRSGDIEMLIEDFLKQPKDIILNNAETQKFPKVEKKILDKIIPTPKQQAINLIENHYPKTFQANPWETKQFYRSKTLDSLEMFNSIKELLEMANKKGNK